MGSDCVINVEGYFQVAFLKYGVTAILPLQLERMC